MMTALGIVLFFLGILVSIAWHELGHFTTAKWFGIKVPEFMVGFGKTIWSRRIGETEFGFKAIPLGGYIRMIGMIPPAKGGTLGRSRRTGPFQGMIDDARQQSAMDVLPEDGDRQFWMRAPWKRIIVMFAGPLMNLILAVVLFAVVLMGIGVPTSGTTIGTVSACVVPATAQSNTCPAGAPKTPAAAAGFQVGDRIVSLNGRELGSTDGEGLRAAIQGAKGQATVVVERAGRRITLTPTLIDNQVQDANNPGKTVQASFLGVGLVGVYARQNVGAVFVQIGDIVGRTGEALIQLPSRVPGLFGSVFLGEQRDQNGPVGIVGASRIGGQILALDAPASAELSFFLQLLAAVNISLFLFNLLPIPPLDGGQIFPAIWEAIKKRGARVLGRPDPGPVDVAKLMPVAYVVALVFIAWSGLLFVADIINPVLLPQ
ncbi:MAG: site-2 protease family protein [Pseudonocardiales bacterium]|nr:site-2 protease family protein [Pseudonocardiales bacterium]